MKVLPWSLASSQKDALRSSEYFNSGHSTTCPALFTDIFFTGASGMRKSGEESFSIRIRVEQANSNSNFDFECPKSLAVNLHWFYELPDLSHAAELKRVGP